MTEVAIDVEMKNILKKDRNKAFLTAIHSLYRTYHSYNWGSTQMHLRYACKS